ncbi:MAG: ribose-5-phosphate isomerase [Chloroflexi bacterium HGW-Chloroflexi-10]|nr:MAG: ribose-5-phosphate isomerase [Chloroflexi bacterium HGW-Chloroflexi-10]
MKIAIINETSAADRNADILAALDGRGHEIYNVGMKKSGEKPELQYIHTGLISALLLNLKKVDIVVGGCGTGIGFMNAVMQYPSVFCGLLHSPLDAWLFAQINAGNCISLALNQGYGWASDINLRFIFDRFFSVEHGKGYPDHRREPQAESRESLKTISRIAHYRMAEIIQNLPEQVVGPALDYPGILEILDIEKIEDEELRKALSKRR